MRRVLASSGHLIAWVFLIYVLAVIVARPSYTSWGTTWAERAMPVPGDSLGASATYRIDHGITVNAPSAAVWPWLVQIGQDRAGFYSYSRLERMVGDDIHNSDQLIAEWQTLDTGDFVRATQPGYLGGLFGDNPGWRVAAVEPGHYMVLDGWGAFIVEPVGRRSTRLLVRTRGDATPTLSSTFLSPGSVFLFEPVHFIMQRGMLYGIRERAERNYVMALRARR